LSVVAREVFAFDSYGFVVEKAVRGVVNGEDETGEADQEAVVWIPEEAAAFGAKVLAKGI